MNAKPWIISFWMVATVFIVVTIIFVFLIIDNYKKKKTLYFNNRYIEYILSKYISESYLCICRIMNISIESKTEHYKEFVKKYSTMLCEKLLLFSRQYEVMTKIIDEISKKDNTGLNIFLFPDVLILKLPVHYYHDLLNLSLNTKNEKMEMNSLSKQFLQKIMGSSRKKIHTENNENKVEMKEHGVLQSEEKTQKVLYKTQETVQV